MASQSDDAGEGPRENINDDTVESLCKQLENTQRRLHDAEHTISGLKAAKDVIAAQNVEFKKENNELREGIAILRFQSSQSGNDGASANTRDNEASQDDNRAQRQEELVEQRGVIRELKRQNSEAVRQSQELRTYILNKEEEHSRKRRRTSSQQDAQETGLIIRVLRKFKNDLKPGNKTIMAFTHSFSALALDMSHVPELQLPQSNYEIYGNIWSFLRFYAASGWRCFRDVCERGPQATKLSTYSVCQIHGSDCEFMIGRTTTNERPAISFRAFSGPTASTQ
ncbi:hypothetical protein IL306_013346 [Fusarium sp. DS 682]|nr:hypothetical protein IL306_013346 [Fusarium sp. DS 682]